MLFLKEVQSYHLLLKRMEDAALPNMTTLLQIMVWNTMKLIAERKHDVVRETLAEYMLDLILLLETRMNGMATKEFQRINQYDSYICMELIGLSKGDDDGVA